MGIRSEPFRGVVLSGDDVQKFERQIASTKPNDAAIQTVQRGVTLATEFEQNGFVRFTPRKKAAR